MSDERIGIVFNIQRFSIHDGPGIRTTVFMKGCPLRCLWCHNPESQSAQPEMSLMPTRCIGCGLCAKVCPTGAIDADSLLTDRALCIRCGACADACPAEARARLGQAMTVEEVVEKVERDRPFYEESGGGVTFSGGEPLAQPKFLLDCISASKEKGLRVVVDTSGYASTETMLQVAEKTDLFLYDLKVVDEDLHRELAGVSSELPLRNLRILAERGHPVWLRCPIVPGSNDTDESLAKLERFLDDLPIRYPLHLLPYHQIGSDKYPRLGRTEPAPTFPTPSEERMLELKARFAARGYATKIGG